MITALLHRHKYKTNYCDIHHSSPNVSYYRTATNFDADEVLSLSPYGDGCDGGNAG